MLTATQADGSKTTSTAFCLRQDGIVATTWSNIANASSATIRTIYDKEIRVAGVLAKDTEHNLVILKVDDGGLSEVQLGQSTYTKANELVFIIGDSLPSVNRMVLGLISPEYKKAREVEEYQPVIPVIGPFTARDNGAPILSGSGGRAIGVALATDPGPGQDKARHTAVVVPIEELRMVMKNMKSVPEPLTPHGDYATSNEGHYWAGRLDEVNGDLLDALKHYQIVLTSDSKNISASFQYAYVSELQGNHDIAAQGYARTLGINPREEKSLFNLGLIQFAQGKLADAEKNFSAAGAAGVKFVKAFDRLGMTQEQLHQPDKALAAYAKAREAKETDTYSSLRIAHILFDQQKWGAAATAAKKAREAGVDSTEIYLIEADSYCHTHSYLQAWDLAHRGTERNSKVSRLWAIMVESSQKLKNDDRAKQELAILQTLDPEAAKLLMNNPAAK